MDKPIRQSGFAQACGHAMGPGILLQSGDGRRARAHDAARRARATTRTARDARIRDSQADGCKWSHVRAAIEIRYDYTV